MKKWNIEKCKSECNKFNLIVLSNNYSGTKKMTFQCKCGNQFDRLFSNVLLGQTICNECRKIDMEKRKSIELKRNFLKLCEYVDKETNLKVIGSYKDYKSNKSKIKTMCSCGSVFYPTANNIFKGKSLNCKTCGDKKSSITRMYSESEVLNIAKSLTGEDVSYSHYNNGHYIKATCRKHGEYVSHFKNFVYNGTRCPICKESKGERLISDILNKMDITHIREKTFNDLKGLNDGFLRFDFYFIHNNVEHAIEYDGIQHYELRFGNNKEDLLNIQKHDVIKDEYCTKNNIKLLRIKYSDYDYIEDILRNFIIY